MADKPVVQPGAPPGPGGTSSTAPPEGAKPPALHCEWLQIFREVITAVIGLSILGVSLWILGKTYCSARDSFKSESADSTKAAAEIKAQVDAFGREKDILLLTMGLLGTVTGYYLGRVPAESRAQNAQQAANSAQNQAASAIKVADKNASMAAQAAQEKDKIKTDSRQTMARIQSLLAEMPRPAAAEEIAATAHPTVAAANQEIRGFLARLE